MPEEKDKIKLMYDAMSGSIELGTPQQFEEALKDKTKRNLIFQTASQKFELGGENDFNNLVDAELKKKSSGIGSSDSGPKDGPLQSGLRSRQQNNHWPQLEISTDPSTGPLSSGLKQQAGGIPWPQLDEKSDVGVQPEFTPKPMQTLDMDKFKVKVQEGVPDAIDPTKGLGEKINKDVEKTTNIMNTYKTAISSLSGKIDSDIKSRDAIAKELKELKAGLETVEQPKTEQEAVAIQAMYEEFNKKVGELEAFQKDAENKYATYQTISKGYERRVKEMDPLMRTLSPDESEWKPYWDRVGAPMLGAFARALPNQLVRTASLVSTLANSPWNWQKSIKEANDFIETTGLKGLDDSAKLKSLEAEKASMKLRIREGTDLETLFKEGINKGNATQILDLAFKQAVASGPITLGIMATTVMTGGGYAAMGAGAGVTFLGAGGAKYAELADRTDMSDTDKLLNSYGEGTFEALFEFLPEALNAKVVINSIKSMGRKQAQSTIKKSLTDTFFDVYAKFFPITAPLGEGIGEVFTGIGQRASDLAFDPKYKDYTDKQKNEYIFGENYSKIKSEFAGGAAGATFFTAPQMLAETVQGIRDPKNRAKIKELFTKKQAIAKDIEEGNLTGQAAEIATEEIGNINGQISEVVKENTIAGETITIDQKGALEELNEEIEAIDNNIALNPNLSPETIAALEAKKKDIEQQIKDISKPIELISKLEQIKLQEENGTETGLEGDKPTEIIGQGIEKPGENQGAGKEDSGSEGASEGKADIEKKIQEELNKQTPIKNENITVDFGNNVSVKYQVITYKDGSVKISTGNEKSKRYDKLSEEAFKDYAKIDFESNAKGVIKTELIKDDYTDKQSQETKASIEKSIRNKYTVDEKADIEKRKREKLAELNVVISNSVIERILPKYGYKSEDYLENGEYDTEKISKVFDEIESKIEAEYQRELAALKIPKDKVEAKEEVDKNIQLSGLNEGFKGVTYNSFDPRGDVGAMNSINNNKSFITTISRNGKDYRVVGLKIKSNAQTGTSGRDNYSFASIEVIGNLPSNIDEILAKKAEENIASVYPNEKNIAFEPIKGVEKLETLSKEQTPEVKEQEEILGNVEAKNSVDLVKEAAKKGTRRVKVTFAPITEDDVKNSPSNQSLIGTQKVEYYDAAGESLDIVNLQKKLGGDVVSIEFVKDLDSKPQGLPLEKEFGIKVKPASKILSDKNSPLSDMLENSYDVYSPAFDKVNEITEQQKQIKDKKSQKYQELESEKNRIESDIRDSSFNFIQDLNDVIKTRAEKEGIVLSAEQLSDIAEKIVDGKYMENVYNTMTASEYLDNLINEYNETDTTGESRSTETIIAESEAIEAEAAGHKPGQSSKSILQKLEDQINSINAKVVKLTETWDESELPEDEMPGRQAGKAAKKEVRKYANEVAKLLGWTASKINDNIAPAGGDVTYRLEVPGTPLEIYVAVKYEPSDINVYGQYENYKIDQFFYRVENPSAKGQSQYVGQNQWMFFNKPQFGLKQEGSIPTPKEFALVLAKEAAPYIERLAKQEPENTSKPQSQIKWTASFPEFTDEAIRRGEDDINVRSDISRGDKQNAGIRANELAKNIFDDMIGEMIQSAHPKTREFNDNRTKFIESISKGILKANGLKDNISQAQEAIKNIVEASGAPKGNVIVTGVKPVEEKPQTPVKKQLSKVDQEIADELEALRKMINLSSGVNPEHLAQAVKITGLFIKKGVLKFADIMQQATDLMGAGIRDIFPAMKQGYLAYMGTAEDIDGMSDMKEVRNFDIESIINKAQNDTNGNEISGGTGRAGDSTIELNAGEQAGGTKQGNMATGESTNAELAGNVPTDDGQPLEVRDEPSTGESRSDLGDIRPELVDVNIQQNWVYPENWVRNPNKTFSKATAYADNIRALEVINDLLNTPERYATNEEKAILSKYNGLGPLVEILKPDNRNNPEWTNSSLPFYEASRQIRELVKNIGIKTQKRDLVINEPQEGTVDENNAYSIALETAKNSSRSAYYTSLPVINAMWNGIMAGGYNGGKVLEGSIGSGRFIGGMPTSLASNTRVKGVDMDVVSTLVSQYLYPKASITNNRIQRASIPSNAYDLFISNIPFGKEGSLYDPLLSKKGKDYTDVLKLNKLHGYFFVKAIDSVRPGGYIAILTSSNTLDTPDNKPVRDFIEKYTDFMGAVRLPSSAFAAESGTEVVTDIIFMRKKAQPLEPVNSELNDIVYKLAPHSNKNKEPQEIRVNGYFERNPQNVMGSEYLAGGLYAASAGYSLAGQIDQEKLVERLKTFSAAFPYQKNDIVSEEDSLKTLQVSPLGRMVSGGIIEVDNSYYRVIDYDGRSSKYNLEEIKKTVLPSLKELPQLKSFVKLKNDYFKVLAADKSGQDATDLRTELKVSLSEFTQAIKPTQIKNIGKGSKRINRLLVSDPDFYSVTSLVNDEGKYADIVSKPIKNEVTGDVKTDNPVDAVAASINTYGRINIPFLKKVMNLNTDNEVLNKITDLAFETLDGDVIENSEYLSGNVREKLNQAKEWVNTDKKFQKNVDALEAVIPKDIPLVYPEGHEKAGEAAIKFQLGASWIPDRYINMFMDVMFGDGNVKIRYVKETDDYEVESDLEGGEYMASGDGTTRDPATVIKAALTKNIPLFTKKISDTESIVLHELTNDVRDKAQRLQTEFQNLIITEPKMGEELGRIYNDTFNSTVNVVRDGSKLTFPGMQGYELNPHQKDAVMMVIQGLGGMIDHTVGAGKTLVMAVAAIKMRQLGLINKPMITTMKSVVPGMVEQIKTQYPDARVLAPKETDFNKDNRQRLFAQIANNDWDVIVITHENLNKIGLPKDFENEYIITEIEELTSAMEDFNGNDSFNTKQRKALQARIAGLRDKLEKMQNKENASTIDFGEMGIDLLMVDESQQFKNLNFMSKLRNVAGLGTAKGSIRAGNLKMVTRFLQNMHGGDKGVVFASGTPISNSLVEVYNIFQYLRPSLMKSLRISSLDQFIKNFGEITTNIEKNVAGVAKSKTRLAKFVNIPELAKFYTEISDIRGLHNLKLPRPDIKGGKPELIMVPQSETVQMITDSIFNASLEGTVDALNEIGIFPGGDAEKALGLVVTTLGTKASIDPRMIFPDMAPDGGKLFVLADEVSKIYHETTDIKGTQLIFADKGTPKNKTASLGVRVKDEIIERYGEEFLNEFTGVDEMLKIKNENDLALKMTEVFEFDDISVAEDIIKEAKNTDAFNVYQETKNLLIRRGIPAEEIAFIHDAPSKNQKEELFAKVKKGQVRVLIGSTMKMGTGVNVQDRVVAMHHLDINWRPSDLEQRNGRGLRRGNMNKEVAIKYYATEGTIDSYMFGIVGIKQTQLDQFRSGAEGVREMEFIDGEGMSLAEISAAISGDTRMLDLEKLKGQEAKLKSRLDSIARTNAIRERRISETKRNLDYYRERRDVTRQEIESLSTVKVEKYEYNEPATDKETGKPLLDKEGNPKMLKKEGKRSIFVGTVNGKSYDTSNREQETAFYNAIAEKIEIENNRENLYPVQLAEINGVPIYTSSDKFYVTHGRKQERIPNPDWTRKLYFGKLEILEIVGRAKKLPGNSVRTFVNGFFNELNEYGNSDLTRAENSYQRAVVDASKASKEPVLEAKEKDIQELAKLSAKKNELINELKGEASGENIELNAKRQIYRPGTRPTQTSNEFAPKDIPNKPQPKGLAARSISALERLKVNTNNNLFGMLPPFALAIPIWNGTISAMQTSIRLTKLASEVIADGLEYIRNQGVQFPYEVEFTEYFESILVGPPEDPQYTPQDIQDEKDAVAQRIKDQYTDIEKTIFGSATSEESDMQDMQTFASGMLGLVNVAQDKTMGELKTYLGDKLANIYAKQAVIDKKLVRNIAGALNGLFANLGKTAEQQLKGESFVGNRERAISDANEISKWLRAAIGNSAESLHRIDQVLDPTFYNKLSLDRFKSYLKDEIGEEDYNAIPEEQFPDWYAQYLLDIGYNEGFEPVTLDQLTPAELEVYTVLRNINNFLHDLNFLNGKIPYSTYLKNKGKYVARLYSKFELPQDVNDMIQNQNNKEYSNIFNKRGEITEWKVSNRLSDPIYATTKRLYQTLMNNAIYEYSDYVLKQPGQVSRIELPGYRLMGRGYGKLTGKYLRDDIAEDFFGFYYANDQLNKVYDVLKNYDRWSPRQFYKKLFTVYNPGVHLGNLTSNYVFAYLSGINAVRLTANVPKALSEINNYGPMYRFLMSKGVLKSSLSRTDLVNSINTLNSLTRDAVESQSVWSKIGDIPTEVYGGVDDVYKIAAYISLLEEGIAPNAAVNKVMEGFQNYKRVGKMYDFTSKIPLVGKPFGKFAGDLLRISKNAAMTRPLQAATFIASLHFIAFMASKMSGEDDRERRIRASRPGFPKIPMPDFMGGDIELGYKVGDNEFNVARLITPLFIYSGVDNGDAYDAWQKFSPLPFQLDTWTMHPSGTGSVNIAKNFGSDPILSPVLQLFLNADFRGVPILDPDETKYKKSTLTDDERLFNAVGFLLRSYGGAYYALFDDLRAASQGEEDYYGREKTPGQVGLRFLGVKIEKFPDTKYGKIMQSKYKSYEYRLEDNTKVMNNIRQLYGMKKIDLDTYKKRMIPVIEERAETVKNMQIDFGAK